MKILFLGDIFGEAGREAVKQLVPKLRSSLGLDFVIGNCENIAAGMGVTPKLANELLAVPIEVLTSGNHIYHHKEIIPFLENNARLLRPANFLPKSPGRGTWAGEVYAGVRLAVINLIGQVFMPGPYNSPFAQVDQELEKLKGNADIIVVDMHGEASSEKMAMGIYLDGRVAAVLGTHTHIPTADETLLPKGTAYITDVGMCGPFRSIIGMRQEEVLQKYVTGVSNKYQPAKDDARLSGVVMDIEESTGKARTIRRIQEKCET
jgi:hypothetical protein